MLTMGTQIRHAMERQNLSKMYVSQLTGITTYNLDKIVNDSMQPNPLEIKRLSKMLGVKL